MKSKKTLLLVAALFMVLLGGAYTLYNNLSSRVETQQFSEMESSVEKEDLSEQEATPKKVAAPDFTVYDLAGNEVHLSDFLGTPVVLNFWASWCGPCQREMPDFQEAFETYGSDVQFLMVNMTAGSRETLDSASAFIANSGFTFPVYYDTALSAASAYGVYSLPTTYFIDAEGYVVTYGMGAMKLEVLKTGINLILLPDA